MSEEITSIWAPVFSVGALAKASAITLETARNWVKRGYLENERLGELERGRHHRFSLTTIFVASLVKEMDLAGFASGDLAFSFKVARVFLQPLTTNAHAERLAGVPFEPFYGQTYLAVYSDEVSMIVTTLPEREMRDLLVETAEKRRKGIFMLNASVIFCEMLARMGRDPELFLREFYDHEYDNRN